MTNEDENPWADRDARFARHVTEPPTRDFFIPGLDDPAEAEHQWSLFADGRRPDSRRVYSLTYTASVDEAVEITVGEKRKSHRRRRGPRGGYLPDADIERLGRRTGTKVLAIVDSGDVIEVWSEPPGGGWANPAMVGPGALERIQYFKPRET